MMIDRLEKSRLLRVLRQIRQNYSCSFAFCLFELFCEVEQFVVRAYVDELALRSLLRGFDLHEGRVINFEHTVATPLIIPEPPYRYQAVLLQHILALFVRRALVLFVVLYFGVLFNSLVILTI
jgi:hypothetical protein